MKAWRLNAADINIRRDAGCKVGTARQQMQEQRMLNKLFPPTGSGNWLLNGLLYSNGYLKPAISYREQVEEVEHLPAPLSPREAWWSAVAAKAKRMLGI